jgi:hypothetical protein
LEQRDSSSGHGSVLDAQKAFEEFESLVMAGYRSAMSHSWEEYLQFVKPFLANPDKHMEHVEAILDMASTARLFASIPALKYGWKWPFTLIFKLDDAPNKEYEAKLDRLKQRIAATAVDPGEIDIDVLPARLVETPSEWTGRQLNLIDLRLAVRSQVYEPDNISFRLEVADQAEVQMVAAYPETQLEEPEEHELGVTNEGKFVVAGEISTQSKASMKLPGVDVSAQISGKVSSSDTRTDKVEHTVKFKSSAAKVISSAVGRTAQWDLLRSRETTLLGGHEFLLTALAPSTMRELTVALKLRITFSKWGLMVREEHRVIPLAQKPVRKR